MTPDGRGNGRGRRRVVGAGLLALGLTALAPAARAATPEAVPIPACARPTAPPAPERVEIAYALANRVTETLDAQGADVALVARVGADLSPYGVGVEFTHAGWLWRPGPGQPWRITHELNPCDSSAARLYETGPAPFFQESRQVDPRALVVVPSPALARRLQAVLAGRAADGLKGANYNFFAHPRSQDGQNCTQWALEVLAAALAPPGSIADRADAQRWLADAGYHGLEVQTRWYERAAIRVALRRVARLDAQPAGRFEMITADSVAAFLAREDAGAVRLVVGRDAPAVSDPARGWPGA